MNPQALFLLHQTLGQAHEGRFQVDGFFLEVGDAEAVVDEDVGDVGVDATGGFVVRDVDELVGVAGQGGAVALDHRGAGDAGHLGEDLCGSFHAFGDRDVDDVADLGAFEDLVDRAGEEQLALLDDADRVAEFGEFVEDVRRDQDRLAHPFEFFEQLADLDAGAGVEAGRGLVHQQDLGVVQEHAGDAETLLHAAAEGRDLGGLLVGQFGEFEDVGDDFFALRAVDVVGGREELQVFVDDHVLVRAHEVGDISDERADLAVLVADGEPVDLGLAGRGLEEGGEDLDGGGFARAVGADEAEAVALVDGEVQGVERDEVVVALGQVDRFDHGHGVVLSLLRRRVRWFATGSVRGHGRASSGGRRAAGRSR